MAQEFTQTGSEESSRELQAPNLLLEWQPTPRNQIGVLAAASVAFHIVLGLLFVAGAQWAPVPVRQVEPVTVGELRSKSTRLIAPPLALTQKAPNRGPVAKEANIASLAPRPSALQMPSPGAAAPPKPTPRTAQLPEARRAPVPAPAALPDLPAPNVGSTQPTLQAPPALGSLTAPAAPPQIAAVEQKPKITFERPGAPTGAGVSPRIAPPKNTLEEAMRQVARSANSGGLIVGDDDSGGGRFPTAPVPVPGKMGSSVELLSDPTGIDFSPYLIRVLAAVRRNWFAVIPESAKLGRVGRSVVRFTIMKEGGVRAVEIAVPSGTEAFDRAAIAGISASNPLPPLPPDYKGREIRLQFVFKYNIK